MKKQSLLLFLSLFIFIGMPNIGWGGGPAKLVSISVTPADPSIGEGATQQFTATGTYSDDSTADITTEVDWESSDTGVATISNDSGSEGLASTIAAGSTTITASKKRISGSTTLTVVPVLVSIDLTPTNPTVTVEENQQFTATGNYSDESTEDITTSVAWDSSDTEVATVSNDPGSEGLASTIAEGSTTITATSGAISGDTTLTVELPVTLLSIDVTPANPTVTAGETQQFTAMGTYSNNSTIDMTAWVVWDSSDTGVATISNDPGTEGVASALSTGPTTISATSGEISDSTTLTVSEPVLSSTNLSRTGQVTTYSTGDDGDLQKGIEWPAFRFMAYTTTEPVMDWLTGLDWAPDGSTPTVGACTGGMKTWQEALDYVACLNTNIYLGYNDWRLPNKKELRSLVNYEEANPGAWLNLQEFRNIQTQLGNYYLSSTTTADGPAFAWALHPWDGTVADSLLKSGTAGFALPVRSGFLIYSTPTALPQTGQTASYATGDDGNLQVGMAWPSPRFTTNGDTTITDNLTGNVWVPEGDTPFFGPCFGGGMKWQEGLDYVACLNANSYLGHSDWRLPNVNELESLVHSGEADTSAWLDTQGFSYMVPNFYWSSTTYAADSPEPWAVTVDFRTGAISHGKKDCGCSYSYVLPIRGGL